MKNRNEERTVRTPYFRVSFPNMFEPKQVNGQGKPKYSVTMIFTPEDDLSGLKAAAKIACEDKWGMDQERWPDELRSPFQEGDAINAKRVRQEKEPFEGYAGNIIVSASSYDPVPLVDTDPKVKILLAQDFYAGCYGRAQLYAHPYDTAGNMGVTFFLNAVQKVAEGEPLSSRTSPTDVFGKIDKPAGGSAAGNSTSVGGLFD